MKRAARHAARAAGNTRYFTGRPCPRGHIAERHVFNGTCVECTAALKRARLAQDPERERALVRARRAANPERERARDRAERQRYGEKKLAATRAWRAAHPDYESNHRNASVQAKLMFALRNRFRAAFRCNAKGGSAVRDLGCTIEELRAWLESQFQPGMTWANYGSWHIDHRRPLSSFNLSDRAQVLVACHWTNLQPLWARDNLSKGTRVDPVYPQILAEVRERLAMAGGVVIEASS